MKVAQNNEMYKFIRMHYVAKGTETAMVAIASTNTII